LLRPVCDRDERAIREMFVAIRRAPMDAAGFDPGTVVRLVEHQFELQRAGHRLTFPHATSEAIVVDGGLVGRVITDDDDDRVVLVDIMIDPDHQRQGIGSRLLADLVARAGSRSVELRIDHGSPVEAWYRRHGFEQVAASDVQAHFVRVPASNVLAATGA
jgi:GNAT superfamily N-acetyltransferase